MSKKSKWLLAVGIAVIVLMTGSVGTLAYFTDYEDAEGGAVIRLQGETELQENPEDDKKTISIKNTGDTDVIVRVGVFGDFIKDYEFDSEDWIQGEDGYWYYLHILEKGQTTSDLVVNIDVQKAEEAEHDFDIVVTHESHRVEYDGTEENKVVKPEGWQYPDISKGMGKEVNG